MFFTMKSTTHAKLSKRLHSSTLYIVIVLISFHYCLAAPVESNYVKFINDLNTHKCTTPEKIQFSTNSSAPEELEQLSNSLKICQNFEAGLRTKEARYLCTEIYENLKVVLCPNSKGMIKPPNVTFSNEVCKDISSLKDVPEEYIFLKRLADGFFCDVLCDQVFEKACQVLLWSYQAKIPVEKLESTDKETTAGNPTRENSEDPGKVTQAKEKTVGTVQGQIKTSVQPSSTLPIHPQKTNSILDQIVKKADQTQPNNLDPSKLNHVNLYQDVGTNIVHQSNEIKNISLNRNTKTTQDITGNDLPENDAGPAEIEDPHDNGDIFDHDMGIDVQSNKEPSQTPANQNNLSNDLTHLTDNKDTPKMPDLPLQPASIEEPALNPNDGFIDPHDGEEFGEGESPRTNSIVPDPRIALSQTQEIKNTQNEEIVRTQAKMTSKDASGIVKSSTTATENKATESKSSATAENKPTEAKSSTTAETKATEAKTSTTAENKATEEKSSTARENKVTESKNLTSTENEATAAKSKLPVTSSGAQTTESKSSTKGESSSVVSPVSEDSSLSTVSIEKMDEGNAHEMPEDREPDQYTDLEKTDGDPDDEYARQEYDGIYEPSKIKEATPEKPSGIEVSKVDVTSQREQNFDEFSPRNKYGQDDVPLIPVVFPEQEDGHFFFYFLSMVLILMAGYLIFHNKQKIIALIVEGRHERRRRSHGAGYKKLETK